MARIARSGQRQVTMLDWFSRLSDPFVDAPVVRPPERMIAFFRYFLAPVRGLLVAIIIVSLLSAVAEMALLVFLGIDRRLGDRDAAGRVLLALRLGAGRHGIRRSW